MKKTLNCNGRLLELSTPAVMGILNLTTDSFYKESRHAGTDEAIFRVSDMIKEGADIIDIGGQSTRPGATMISAEEEWKRIEIPLAEICRSFPKTIFSIDTFHSSVAEKAISAGCSIVNDISAGAIDARIHQVAASAKVPYVLMHMLGLPENMQQNPSYENIVKQILDFFIRMTESLQSKGITDIIIDPGFGFGKTTQHNFALLQNLNIFSAMERPLMCGLSRKGMISRTLNVESSAALNGSTVLNTIALTKGAAILRVHDVKEAVEVRTLFKMLDPQ